jgi:hypothetical protein
MNISARSREGQAPVTVLVGRMRDQAELLGVVNSLNELHLPILSVEIIESEESDLGYSKETSHINNQGQ